MNKIFLLSSGKSTIISDFDWLENREVYKHENKYPTDFQFFPRQLVFAELNKIDRVEILRINEKEDKTLKIQRINQLTDNDAVCIACPKSCQEQMALGMRNGKLKLYDHTRSKTVHQFPSAAAMTCAYHLDYNSSDEYLSAVYENGLIYIFSVNTNLKMETIIIDEVSTLTRFHPTERSRLSIASYLGNILLYDIELNRKTSHYTNVHMLPCRDLCMSPALPEILVSVGLDRRVNIFDIRCNVLVKKFYQYHPLSTVALSGCGKYFCIGNDCGELAAFDMRNCRNHLIRKEVHCGPVRRIAFFSTNEEKDISPNKPNLSTIHEMQEVPTNMSYKTRPAFEMSPSALSKPTCSFNNTFKLKNLRDLQLETYENNRNTTFTVSKRCNGTCNFLHFHREFYGVSEIPCNENLRAETILAKAARTDKSDCLQQTNRVSKPYYIPEYSEASKRILESINNSASKSPYNKKSRVEIDSEPSRTDRLESQQSQQANEVSNLSSKSIVIPEHVLTSTRISRNCL